MTDAEQFLADLEAKAKAATPGPWGKGIAIRRGYGVTAVLDSEGNNIADMEHSQFTEKEEEFNAAFIAAASPAAVLRLVGMVRNAITQSDLSSEIPPLRIRREYDEMRELNCPWCGGSGHVGDCDEADQAVKRQLEQLEKEADWLATAAANGGWHGVRVSPKQMRDAARKALGEEA